jgi:NO-binding membrane sensor protein with MHYT domain
MLDRPQILYYDNLLSFSSLFNSPSCILSFSGLPLVTYVLSREAFYISKGGINFKKICLVGLGIACMRYQGMDG